MRERVAIVGDPSVGGAGSAMVKAPTYPWIARTYRTINKQYGKKHWVAYYKLTGIKLAPFESVEPLSKFK
jgi:hypothetical protein